MHMFFRTERTHYQRQASLHFLFLCRSVSSVLKVKFSPRQSFFPIFLAAACLSVHSPFLLFECVGAPSPFIHKKIHILPIYFRGSFSQCMLLKNKQPLKTPVFKQHPGAYVLFFSCVCNLFEKAWEVPLLFVPFFGARAPTLAFRGMLCCCSFPPLLERKYLLLFLTSISSISLIPRTSWCLPFDDLHELASPVCACVTFYLRVVVSIVVLLLYKKRGVLARRFSLVGICWSLCCPSLVYPSAHTILLKFLCLLFPLSLISIFLYGCQVVL